MREILFRFVSRHKKTGKISIRSHTLEEIEENDSWQGLTPWIRLSVDIYIGVDDSRGKKIFEGDILLVICDGIRSVHEVIWGGKDYPAYSLYPDLDVDCNDFSQLENAGGYKTRVIGNIHDNPELLKERII